MLSTQRRIRSIAVQQYGYFSAGQAKQCGFSDKLHAYHCKVGNWLKYDYGLFRLPDFENSLPAECMRWMLWSRNNRDQPQGVISHASALSLNGLGDYDPENIHLVVPLRFRKKTPPGIILHRKSLNLSAIESKDGLMVTRLPNTLADLRSFLVAHDAWEKTVENALEAGKLSWTECLQLGFARRAGSPVSASTPVSGSTPDQDRPGLEETVGPQAVSTFSPEPAVFAAEDSPGLNGATLMRERIYKMIFQRSQANRNARRRTQAGFTLVELLVVIAIISILAGMLLPALEKTLSTARQVQCANNQKQLALAVLLYADGNGDYLPANTVWADMWNGNVRFWFDKLRTAGFLTPRDTWTKLKDNPNRITCCPEAGRNYWLEVSTNIVEIPAVSADYTPSTYGINLRILGSQLWEAGRTLPKQAIIRNPAAGVFFIDALMGSTYPWSGYNHFGFYDATHFAGVLHAASPRHNGRVNAAHADGHVSAFLPLISSFPEDRWKDMFPVN